AILLVPVAFAVERLIKRDALRIADGVLAAVLAHGVTLATDLWVARAAPDAIQDALTQLAPGGSGATAALTDPVHGYLAPVIAFMTAVGLSRRPRWRTVLWMVLVLDAFSMLVSGYTTPFSIVLTILIGWSVAYGTLYAVGSPNVRPTGRTLMAGLRHVGFRPASARQETESGESHESDRGRRYFVTLEDGRPLDVTVVDREQQAQAFYYRVWRNLTLRGSATRRSLQSLRQALEQEALLAYAAIAAGANAPKLIATAELGPDAVMLVYEHTGGRPLDQLDDAEITDELLRDTWRQVKALQSRRLAHRRLAGDAILVDRSGGVILSDLRGGEIAAGDLLLRMDIAQLLTTLGLRVGAERAVAAAVEVLGPDAVADCLPLLQPIAL
ncbi:TIGR00374 family protein, partial [Streptomyces sp. UH6]|nr:TIGR00374 family protein [Streptomyces sp. UH6]